MQKFSGWKNELRSYTPSCSAFSTVLTDQNILNIATDWAPIEEGMRCLCIARPHLARQRYQKALKPPSLLESYNLDPNLCKIVNKESRELTFVKYFESLCFSVISFLPDFLWMCKTWPKTGITPAPKSTRLGQIGSCRLCLQTWSKRLVFMGCSAVSHPSVRDVKATYF